jgi:hypothetical protein
MAKTIVQGTENCIMMGDGALRCCDLASGAASRIRRFRRFWVPIFAGWGKNVNIAYMVIDYEKHFSERLSRVPNDGFCGDVSLLSVPADNVTATIPTEGFGFFNQDTLFYSLPAIKKSSIHAHPSCR